MTHSTKRKKAKLKRAKLTPKEHQLQMLLSFDSQTQFLNTLPHTTHSQLIKSSFIFIATPHIEDIEIIIIEPVQCTHCSLLQIFLSLFDIKLYTYLLSVAKVGSVGLIINC